MKKVLLTALLAALPSAGAATLVFGANGAPSAIVTTSAPVRTNKRRWITSIMMVRMACNSAENPSAIKTTAVRMTMGWSTVPKATVFTRSCVTSGTTSDINPITTE